MYSTNNLLFVIAIFPHIIWGISLYRLNKKKNYRPSLEIIDTRQTENDVNETDLIKKSENTLITSEKPSIPETTPETTVKRTLSRMPLGAPRKNIRRQS